MSTIASDSPLTARDTRTLAALAAMMIPPSVTHGIPGADDESILNEILATARQHAELLEAGLGRLESSAQAEHGTPFTELVTETRRALVEADRVDEPMFYRVLVSITVQCYYRDPRVMESLGMEARPPFPEGYEVPEGDWSLLDPVRDRGRIWRDA